MERAPHSGFKLDKSISVADVIITITVFFGIVTYMFGIDKETVKNAQDIVSLKQADRRLEYQAERRENLMIDKLEIIEKKLDNAIAKGVI